MADEPKFTEAQIRAMMEMAFASKGELPDYAYIPETGVMLRLSDGVEVCPQCCKPECDCGPV